MRGPLLDLGTVSHLPENDLTVFATRSEDIAIHAPVEVGYRERVALQCVEFVAGGRFPDIEISIPVSRCVNDSVGAVGGREEPVGVLLDGIDLFDFDGVPELDNPSRPAHDGLLEVGGNVRAENDVEFLADLDHPLAGLDVPSDHIPRLAGPASAAEKVGTVGAEIEGLGESFGVGKDPEQVEVGGVIKENLLLPCHREDGRPRAVGEGGNGVGARRDDRRFEDEVFRHRRGALGFAGCTHRSEVELGFVGLSCLGILGFEQSPGDPVGNDLQFGVGHFRALGRHDGLLDMGRESEETGCFGILGDHHGPTRPACKRGRVAREVEAALGFIGVVAAEALGVENREDIVGEGLLRVGVGTQKSRRGAKGEEADSSEMRGFLHLESESDLGSLRTVGKLVRSGKNHARAAFIPRKPVKVYDHFLFSSSGIASRKCGERMARNGPLAFPHCGSTRKRLL